MKKIITILGSILLFSCSTTEELVKTKNNPLDFGQDTPCRISKILEGDEMYSEYKYDEKNRLSRVNFFKKGENNLSHFLEYDKWSRLKSIDAYFFYSDTLHSDGYIARRVGKHEFKYKKKSTQLDVIKSFGGHFTRRDPYRKIKMRHRESYFFKYDSNSKIVEIQKKKKRKGKKGLKVVIQYDQKLNPIFIELFSLATEKLIATTTNEFDNSKNLVYEFFDFANIIPVKYFNKILSHEVKVYEGYSEEYSGSNSGHAIISLKWLYDYNEKGLVKSSKKLLKNDDEKRKNDRVQYNYVYICD